MANGEVVIATDSANLRQFSPVVSDLGGGYSVAAWNSNLPSGETTVAFRVLGPSGTPITVESRVLDRGADETSASVVSLGATAGGYRFAVVYEGWSADWIPGIYGEIYEFNATTQAISRVRSFDVDVNPSNDSTYPSAVVANGRLVIAWHQVAGFYSGQSPDPRIAVRTFDLEGSNGSGVTSISDPDDNSWGYGTALSANGSTVTVEWNQTNPYIDSFTVNTDGTLSNVAANNAGDGIHEYGPGVGVLWSSTVLTNGTILQLYSDDGGDILYAREIGSAPPFAPVKPPVIVNTSVSEYGPVSADATTLPGGGYMIVWARPVDAANIRLFARLYDEAGTARTDEFLVSNGTSFGKASHPQIAQGPNGGVIIVWESDTTNNGREDNDIVSRLYDNIGPTATGAPAHLADIQEDFTSSAGVSIISLVGSRFDDQDNHALAGVAVVANGAAVGQGTWQYSINGGAQWAGLATNLSNANATILTATTLIRFVPAANYNGTPGLLSVRLWDGQGGFGSGEGRNISGSIFDASDLSGSSLTGAFSGKTVALGITVLPVNDAPAMGANLGASTQTGNLLTIISGHLSASDPDDAGTGLVYTVTDATDQGTLFRDGNGNNIVDGGEALSAASTFTQADIDGGRIKYLHGGGAGPSDNFIFSLADGGEDGAQAVTGQTFNIVIIARPVVTVGGAPTPTHTEGGTATSVAPAVTVVDTDSASLAGATLTITDFVAGDVLGFVAANGITGSYNASTGVLTLTGTAGVADYQAALRSVTYSTTSDNPSVGAGNADRVISVKVSDSGGLDSAPVSVTLSVVATNDAPVLDIAASPTLTGIAEDLAGPTNGSTANSTLVAALLGGMSDVDVGALQGVAVTGVSTQGSLWYSLDSGASWTQVTAALSATNALLLHSDARIYFKPASNLNGTLSDALTFKAWDRSDGHLNGVTGIDTTSGSAFSAAVDTASVTISSVNDSPILADTELALDPVTEDSGSPVGATGTLVSSLIGGISDADLGALRGIAIVGADTTQGTWFFSTDNGSQWQSLGAPSAGAGRLLMADAGTRLYFHPAADYQGTVLAGLTIRAWDATSGTNGSTADVTSTGGSTAFSATTDTVSVSVTAVNDAPVATLPSSIAVSEDTATALTGISFADIDAAAAAVTVTLSVPAGSLSATSAAGVTVGGTASALTLTGAIADINAFIAARGVAYTPAANETGTRVLTVSIDDDGNSGSGGSLSDTETVDLTISAANDAPVVTVPATVLVQEDVSTALTGISVADVDAATGLVTVTVSVPSGTLAASSGGGVAVGGTASALTLSGTIVDINAFIAASQVTFLGAANASGDVEVTVSISDNGNVGTGGAKADQAEFTLVVTPVNDAPMLDATLSPALTGTSEDPGHPVNGSTTGSTRVADLLGGVSDVDTDARQGIAITGVSSQGTLWYSLDNGTNWIAFTGTASDTSALVLHDDALVYFEPVANVNGIISDAITFRAWDRSGTAADSGTSGVNVSTNGGSSAYSSVTDTVAVTVSALNDKPVLGDTDSGPYSYTEQTGMAAVGNQIGTLTDVDSTTVTAGVTIGGYVDGDALSFTVGTTGVEVTPMGNGVYMLSSSSLADMQAVLQSATFNSTSDNPTAGGATTRTITFQVNDGQSLNNLSDPITATVNVTTVNDAPAISQFLAGLDINDTETGKPFPDVAISDLDGADTILTATITLDKTGTGSLSNLGGFAQDPDGRYSFSGTAAQLQAALRGIVFVPVENAGAPGQSVETTLSLVVSDGELSDDQSLTVVVQPVNDTPVAIDDGPVAVAENGTVTATALTGVLANDTDADCDVLSVRAASQGGAPGVAAGTAITGIYGALMLNVDGSYAYVANTAAAEVLGEGVVGTDGFSYTISDGQGGTHSASLTFEVTGENDAASFKGTDTGAVVEDGTLGASGILTVADIDDGQAGFQSQADQRGTYGTFSFEASTGSWRYVLANADPAVQSLGSDEIRTEQFTVKSLDGTVQIIRITVGGTEDIVIPVFTSGRDRFVDTDASSLLHGLTGHDTIDGGGGNDSLYGDSGRDRLDGGAGNDRLYGGTSHDTLLGGAGDDLIRGEAGKDWIRGGLGRDKMWGGAGADIFDFDTIKDSRVGAQRDMIHDFQSGVDRVDLRTIDANTLVKGNQAFTWTDVLVPFLNPGDASAFLSAAFTGTAGQLRYADGILMGDVDGNGRSDFQIRIVGHFSAGDVLL